MGVGDFVCIEVMVMVIEFAAINSIRGKVIGKVESGTDRQLIFESMERYQITENFLN